MYLAPVFALAYVADLLLGDPETWPHPVRWMGRASLVLEKYFYAPSLIAGVRHWLLIMVLVCLGLYLFTSLISLHIGLEFFATTWLVYTGLATRSLHTACAEVASCLALSSDLTLARKKLSRIVSRETAHLDEESIQRAILETMSENLSDGVIAPILYLTLGGPWLMIIYKAINTLDSMIGYTNTTYMLFGRWAARVDDVAGFIPARLTGLLIVLSALLLGENWKRAWKIMLRDGSKTSSPNAGVPEAAFAGALGVRLGGTSTYFGQTIHKHHLGDALHQPGPKDYALAVRLLYATSLQAALLCIFCLLLTHATWWGCMGWIWS